MRKIKEVRPEAASVLESKWCISFWCVALMLTTCSGTVVHYPDLICCYRWRSPGWLVPSGSDRSAGAVSWRGETQMEKGSLWDNYVCEGAQNPFSFFYETSTFHLYMPNVSLDKFCDQIFLFQKSIFPLDWFKTPSGTHKQNHFITVQSLSSSLWWWI